MARSCVTSLESAVSYFEVFDVHGPAVVLVSWVLIFIETIGLETIDLREWAMTLRGQSKM